MLGVVRHSLLRGQPVLANKSPNTPFCDKGMQQMGKKISTHKGKDKKGKHTQKKLRGPRTRRAKIQQSVKTDFWGSNYLRSIG